MYINKTNWPTSRRGSFVTCRRWGMESAGSSHSKERWLDNTCIFHWWRKKETSNVWKIMMNGRTTVSRGNRTIGWCPISRFHWITWAPCTIVRVNLLRSQLLGHRAWRKRWVIVNRIFTFWLRVAPRACTSLIPLTWWFTFWMGSLATLGGFWDGYPCNCHELAKDKRSGAMRPTNSPIEAG